MNRLGNVAGALAAPRKERSAKEPTEATEATSSTGATKDTKATKWNGRPRRAPYVKLHVTIDEALAAYVNEAWRTHRNLEGQLVNGPSAFLEDLVARHRAKRSG